LDKRTIKELGLPSRVLIPLGRALLLVALALAVALLRVTPQTWWAGSSFAAAAVIFFFRETQWMLRIAALVLGLALSIAYWAIHPDAQTWVTTLAYGLGTASFCIAAARASASEVHEFAARFRTALVVGLFLISLYVDAPVLVGAAARTPLTFDVVLTAADRALGGDVSFAVGTFLRNHSILCALSRQVYYCLPIAVMLAAGLRWRRYGASDETSIPMTVALGGALAPVLYVVVPAAGPIFRWGGRFPYDPPAVVANSMTPSQLEMPGVLNAMPSLHFAYALLVLWGLWSLGLVARSFGVAFAILTLLATLGLGEHYFVDLVVAVPFAMFLELVIRRPAGWVLAAAACALLVVGWLLSLRLAPFAWASPVVVWVAILVTALGLTPVLRRVYMGLAAARATNRLPAASDLGLSLDP
jgi:hypothetical protein